MSSLVSHRLLLFGRTCFAGLLLCCCAFWYVQPTLGQTDRLSQLLEDLKNPKLEVGNEAANELVRDKDPRAVEPLIADLNDKSYHVRLIAAYVLGKLPSKKRTGAFD